MKGKETNKTFVHYLPVYGCASTGMIYVGIGIIAILSFLKIKHGGADESSLLLFLYGFLVGKLFFWIILTGTISYIIWRIYETIHDPYQYGKGRGGIAKRTGIALSTVADAFIVFSAIQVIVGRGNIKEDGQPVALRSLVSNIMKESWGEGFIIGAGIVIFVTAVVQFVYGVTRGYKERMDIKNFSRDKKEVIHLFAWVGYLARGIILGIIGFFFVKAGITKNAGLVVNTDKAFDFIGDDVGHLWFILVAVGTIFYGLFMFSLAVAYDANIERKD
jgi:hypothetical protein